jgi:hypothetical protein
VKAFRFELAGLARRFGVEESLASRALAAARQEELRAERAYLEAARRYELQAHVSGSISQPELMRLRSAGELLALAALEAAEASRGAARRAKEALASWQSCHRRVEVLARVEERRRQQWLRQARREEAKGQDDLAGAAFTRRQAESAPAGFAALGRGTK